MRPYLRGETRPEVRARYWMEYLMALHAAHQFISGEKDLPAMYLDLIDEIGYIAQHDEEEALEKVQNLAYEDVTVEVKQTYRFNSDGSKRNVAWHYEARLHEPDLPEAEEVRIVGIFREGDLLDGTTATFMVPEFETAKFVIFRPDTKAEQEAMEWFARNLDEA